MKTVKPFGRGLADGLLRVSLFDRNAEVARALADAFREVAGVEVLEGELLGLECDAVVSRANSFGYMDGGIDAEIERRKSRREMNSQFPVPECRVSAIRCLLIFVDFRQP